MSLTTLAEDHNFLESQQIQLDKAKLEIHRLLWKAQLEYHPDSVEVHLYDAIRWKAETPPNVEEAVANRKKILPSGHLSDFVDLVFANYRLHVASHLTMCLQFPTGVFYQCGRKVDGEYRYRGYRFGVLPHECLGGFGR